MSVGNLAVGGRAKTPLVISIVKWLGQEGYRPVVLTRGYGREEMLDLDYESNLPRPSQGNVEYWWEKHQQEFRSGTRYLAGTPITAPSARADTFSSERNGYRSHELVGKSLTIAAAGGFASLQAMRYHSRQDGLDVIW